MTRLWFCIISLPFSSRSIVLLVSPLPITLRVGFFVPPHPINIISSHSFPRTNPSHFIIFQKICFTSKSYFIFLPTVSFLYSFFRLTYSFSLSLSLSLSLSVMSRSRFRTVSPDFPSHHSRFSSSIKTMVSMIPPNRSSFQYSLQLLQLSRLKMFPLHYPIRDPIPSFSNSYSRLIVFSLSPLSPLGSARRRAFRLFPFN